MAIELPLTVRADLPAPTPEDTRVATFASAEALLHVLGTEDSSLRRQINRSYPRLAQVFTVAARLLGSTDAAWQWLNTNNAALKDGRTPLQELAQDPQTYRVESLLRPMAEKTESIEGVCFFWSETGTEGGYWAFHDTRFTVPSFAKVCRRCHLYWADNCDAAPAPTDPQHCPPGTHDWMPMNEAREEWLYGGLHVLKNGDQLTIFSKEYPHKVLWKGEIHLEHLGLFQEDAFGFWIHDDQVGMDRETWAEYFLKEYPARLEPAKQQRSDGA